MVVDRYNLFARLQLKLRLWLVAIRKLLNIRGKARGIAA
jgi:hypothetical protein